jgi:hypothetical protein
VRRVCVMQRSKMSKLGWQIGSAEAPQAATGDEKAIAKSPAEDSAGEGRGLTRRSVVGIGVKAAFIAPLLSTFLASEAQAAGSNHSCYPTGHACPGLEPCCNGACLGGAGCP